MATKKTTPKTEKKPTSRPVKCKDVKAFVRAAKGIKLPRKLSATFAFGADTVTITAKGQTAPVLEFHGTPGDLAKALLTALGVKDFK